MLVFALSHYVYSFSQRIALFISILNFALLFRSLLRFQCRPCDRIVRHTVWVWALSDVKTFLIHCGIESHPHTSSYSRETCRNGRMKETGTVVYQKYWRGSGMTAILFGQNCWLDSWMRSSIEFCGCLFRFVNNYPKSRSTLIRFYRSSSASIAWCVWK